MLVVIAVLAWLGITVPPALGATPTAVDPIAAGAPASKPPRNILLLYDYARLAPAILAHEEAFRLAFKAYQAEPVNIYTEYLNLTQLDFEERFPEETLAYLRAKYASAGLDVIALTNSRTLRFVLRHRDRLFPGVPIVFSAVSKAAAGNPKLDRDVTGVWLAIDWAATLDAALRIQPHTDRVMVITGGSRVDRVWADAARTQLTSLRRPIEIEYMPALPFDDVIARVSALGGHTVALLGAFVQDSTGRNFTGIEVASRITAAAKVPVYTLVDQMIGTGVVGGRVVSFEAQGRTAAQLALRVLQGERPPPLESDENVFVFDARQLRRWGLDRRLLPQGALVMFDQPSLWRLYRGYIVGAAILLVLQSALIAALLFQKAKRRRAQSELAVRLRFETLLSDLSAQFSSLPTGDVDRHIRDALQRIAEGLAVDLVSVGAVSDSGHQLRATHSWTHQSVAGLLERFERGSTPWIASRLRAGQAVSFSRPEDLPAEADADRDALVECGVKSLTAVPLDAGAPLGFLSVAAARTAPEWPGDLTPRLALLAEVFANALARQRAEHAMRESEARFRRMADAAPVMVWLSDGDAGSHRAYVNQRWLDFTGRSADGGHGDLWLADVHGADRDKVLEAIQSAAGERRAFTVEYRLRRRDGEYRFVLDRGVPRSEQAGTFDGYIGSAIDITELRRAQQALVETDALRSAIFGSLYGRVAALDHEGVIIAVNEAWARSGQGLGPGLAALGVGDDYLAACRHAVAAGDVEAFRTLDAISRVLDGRSDHMQIEYLCPTPSGDRWFEMAVEPLRRPEGGVVVVHIDVTRRREAEEETRRQREQLAHVLRVTTLGELAASLAHEINQPLTAIITDAQAGQRLLGPAHAEVSEALDDIVADAQRASDIIRGLRALFRKEHEQPAAIDVNGLVREVAGLLRADLLRKRIGISFALTPDLPRVFGDSVQLQQVVLNVLVNASDAIEATEDGLREIALVTEAPSADRVEIRVEDTGVGVKPTQLDRIFDHFVTSKPQGLGMGLAISRSIVKAHEGRIWASPAPVRGLHVHIELPCGSVAA